MDKTKRKLEREAKYRLGEATDGAQDQIDGLFDRIKDFTRLHHTSYVMAPTAFDVNQNKYLALQGPALAIKP